MFYTTHCGTVHSKRTWRSQCAVERLQTCTGFQNRKVHEHYCFTNEHCCSLPTRSLKERVRGYGGVACAPAAHRHFTDESSPCNRRFDTWIHAPNKSGDQRINTSFGTFHSTLFEPNNANKKRTIFVSTRHIYFF